MELLTVVFFSLLISAIRDVQADRSLADLDTRVRVVERYMETSKRAVHTETNMNHDLKILESSLNEVIKRLTNQALAEILTEDFMVNITCRHVLDKVDNLKTEVQNIATQLKATTQELRDAERERDTYRELGKVRDKFNEDIRALELQVNQTAHDATLSARMLSSRLNETIGDLSDTRYTVSCLTEDFMTMNTSCCGTRPDITTTTASSDPRPNKTFPPAPVTTQDSDLHGRLENLAGRKNTVPPVINRLEKPAGRKNTVPPAIVTTQVSDLQGRWKTPAGGKNTVTTQNSDLQGGVENLVGRNTAVPPTPVTTQDSDLQVTTDPSPNKTVPSASVSTQDSDLSATPSPATGLDLYNASRSGDLETVMRIISAGHVNINYRGWHSRTPVMAAAWEEQSDVVEFLVGSGADVSLLDKSGNNILHLACWGAGDLETVELILSLNLLDINSREQNRRTPVMAAAWKGHRGVVELLVVRGADVSLVDGDGDNILHLACWGAGDLETVELILSLNKVDINSRGLWARTPVMLAAWKGHRDVVELLVGRGADVSLVAKDGDNVLHYACLGGDLETVKLILLLNKVDINARNNYGQTAADKARGGGHQQVLDLLVSRGTH